MLSYTKPLAITSQITIILAITSKFTTISAITFQITIILTIASRNFNFILLYQTQH